MTPTRPPPSAFVSYAWEDDDHRQWVRAFALRLRAHGINVILDRWQLAPGDQLTAFMERGVSDSDFVIIICTPQYKERSEDRLGGVGYEGNIITSEVAIEQHHRKFIPILRRSEWKLAAPSWLLGKVYIDLRGDPYPEPRYDDLVLTLHGKREPAPPIGTQPIEALTAPGSLDLLSESEREKAIMARDEGTQGVAKSGPLVDCVLCAGSGFDYSGDPSRCQTCKGSGKLTGAQAWDLKNWDNSSSGSIVVGTIGGLVAGVMMAPWTAGLSLLAVPGAYGLVKAGRSRWEEKRRLERPAGCYATSPLQGRTCKCPSCDPDK